MTYILALVGLMLIALGVFGKSEYALVEFVNPVVVGLGVLCFGLAAVVDLLTKIAARLEQLNDSLAGFLTNRRTIGDDS